MAGKIFISYLRDADLSLSERLFERLRQSFRGEQLVFEVGTVNLGVDYGNVLSDQVGECDVLLAIISNGLLDWHDDAADARGLDNPSGWVRFEIEAALKQGKPVIPVLMGKTRMPSRDRLPAIMRPITGRKAMRIRSETFDIDTSSVIKAMQRILGEVEINPSKDVIARNDRDEKTQAPEIPEQGYGPHFEIGDDGIISFAPPAALDRDGNNIDRLEKMHPGLRDISRALVQALGKGNVPHNHLLARSEAYHELIDQQLERIDFSLLYIAGVRLANAEKAAAADSDLPSLAVPVRETIDSLLQLHGTFMLASVQGLEAIAAEERYQRTRQEEIEYRQAALGFAKSLQGQPKVIDPKVASTILDAVEEIGKGANPERSGTVATGIMKNVTVTFSIAAALGALSTGALAAGSAPLMAVTGAAVLVAAEGLKKSKPFADLAAFITRGIDKTAQGELASTVENLRERFKLQLQFFLSAQQHFRRLAGRREEFDWLTKTARWIELQAGAEQRTGQKSPDPGPKPSGNVEPSIPEQAPTPEEPRTAPTLDALRAFLEQFDGCALKSTATRLVFADGNPQARIMFVGEAPGRDEDLEGRPFVGRSGKLLDRMLAAIGRDRSSVYLANVIPWRPPGNRTPTPQETQICLPFIKRQIELVNPDVLVTLGNPTSQLLLSTRDGIMKTRGKWFEYDTGTRVIRAVATFHPSYLLRMPAQKRLAWQDLRAIAKALEQPPPR
jgi:uracil-DNA glycosylase family 4